MVARIAITMGDPTGIGPEVLVKALESPLDASCLIFGCQDVFRRLGLQIPRGVELRETGEDPGDRPTAAAAGRAQLSALDAALDVVLRKEADALCTAPITKASVREAGFRFPGHTEYLAHRTGTGRFAMMLAGPDLRVVPLTGHLPLSQVPETLTAGLVADGAVVTARALVEDFGLSRPRLALAGLNPHAGESGMLGQEEQQVLAPGLDAARRELDALGLDVELSGPLPADGLFVPPRTHDAVLCCYHDQALIPLKLLHRNQAVNVTLGLPIVRTSPAHGTAPDIAGQGRADPGSMRAALELALQLVRRRAG